MRASRLNWISMSQFQDFTSIWKKKQFHGKSQILAIGVQKGFEWSSRNLPARLSFQAALLVSNAWKYSKFFCRVMKFLNKITCKICKMLFKVFAVVIGENVNKFFPFFMAYVCCGSFFVWEIQLTFKSSFGFSIFSSSFSRKRFVQSLNQSTHLYCSLF